ncbi:MAG: dienelactone hydrolase family protein [Planctomycetota bacterium]
MKNCVLLLALALPTAFGRQDSKPWTGVLDEAAFAALHELTENEAPPLLGTQIEVAGARGYLSLPREIETLGGIVVIHEWWGLNEHIKHWTDRLAADGYAALAIDLYGGTIATTRDEALAAMQAVDAEAALATLRAARAYLVEKQGVERTASIGWCFGGGWSLKLAIAEPELDAAVVYYGQLIDDPAVLTSIEAPVLGVFGNDDSSIPVSAVDAFAKAMEKAGKSLELHRYDAEHAFANPSSARYDEEHAAAAWRATRGFLARELWPAESREQLLASERELGFQQSEGWTQLPERAMRLVSFRVGPETECYVSAFPGEAGGVAANLERWSRQMDVPPLDAEAIGELPRIPMLATLAPLVRIDGPAPAEGAETPRMTLLGAIAPRDGETVFAKLVGPTHVVEGHLLAFERFCRSLR